MNEASKCRDRVLTYLSGCGIDIGCGSDRITPNAIGVDLAPSAQLVGDAIDLYWFRDNVLDFVFSSHCLEDIVDTKRALKEWCRVIKPGGHLVLYLPHKHYYPNIGKPYANTNHKHDFLPGDITQPLFDLNMDVISCQTYTPSSGYYDPHKHLTDEYSFEIVAIKR
jgi:predicted SAM-dependent methyltransferase